MTDTEPQAFFQRDDDWYVGNDPARGPWSADGCHAGPVTGVIAAAAERLIDDKQLVRLTVNYVRPVPMAGFATIAEPAGSGRSAASATITLRDRDGKLCATAQSLHITLNEIPEPPTARPSAPRFEEASEGSFPVKAPLHDLPFFGSEVEAAYPPGEDNEPGPTTIWMRCPPIVDGEPTSPFQSLCPLADCANGFARNADFTDVSCVNPDLTILVHRLPRSDWLASKGVSFWEASGIGSTQATLYDTDGVIGSALQSLVIRPLT